jgi:hypothetical protein
MIVLPPPVAKLEQRCPPAGGEGAAQRLDAGCQQFIYRRGFRRGQGNCFAGGGRLL